MHHLLAKGDNPWYFSIQSEKRNTDGHSWLAKKLAMMLCILETMFFFKFTKKMPININETTVRVLGFNSALIFYALLKLILS